MKIPRHIAFIMDGNGRWANERGLTRTEGHQVGFRNLIDVVDACNELGVEAMTCYAFSTENWNRPDDEVKYLMEIPSQLDRENKEDFQEKNVRVKFIGRKDRVPASTLAAMNELEEFSKDNTGMEVAICFDYGSHNEMIHAVKEIVKDVQNGLSVEKIDEELFESKLFTNGMPPIDLLVRTSGEYRISNFLMWQLAYSELYFPKTYWPDFKKDNLLEAISEYNKRSRRFGTIKEE